MITKIILIFKRGKHLTYVKTAF